MRLVPSIGEWRLNARECTRWAEASADEEIPKVFWTARVRNAQAAAHPGATERGPRQKCVGLGVRAEGFTCDRSLCAIFTGSRKKPRGPADLAAASHRDIMGRKISPPQSPQP